MTTDEGSAYKNQKAGFGADLSKEKSDTKKGSKTTPIKLSPAARLWESRLLYTLSAIGLAGSSQLNGIAGIYCAFRRINPDKFFGDACRFFDDNIRHNCNNAHKARQELIRQQQRKTKSTVSAPTPPR